MPTKETLTRQRQKNTQAKAIEFTPLEVVSSYSLLGPNKKVATSHPADLVMAAKRAGYSQIGLAETNFAGLGQFVSAGRVQDVTITPGVELPVHLPNQEQPTYLTLLAQNNPGLYFLYRIASSYAADNTIPTVAEIYQRTSEEGVVVLWKDTVPDLSEYLTDDMSFYAVNNARAETLARAKVIFKRTPEKTVVSHEVRLASPHEIPVFTFIQQAYPGIPLPEKQYQYPMNATMKHPLEIAAMYRRWDKAVARSSEIAASCRVTFPRKPELKAVIAGERDSYQVLEELVEEHFRRMELPRKEKLALADRLRAELRIIKGLELSDYFLVCYEIMQFCNEQKILFGVSGSGNNSAVLWNLGIVRTNPMEFFVERFTNPYRRFNLPDIDFLLPYDRRAGVIHFLLRRYPTEATLTSVINRAGMPTIIKAVKKAPPAIQTLVREHLETIVAAELPWTVSTHASAVARIPYAPVWRTGSGKQVAMFDKGTAENVFVLPKFDLLPSDAVSHIADTNIYYGADIPIPPGDSKSLERIFQGNTVALTSAESPHLQGVLASIGHIGTVNDLEHVAQALAVARPQSSARREYFDNIERVVHPFDAYPELSVIFKKTHNVLIYQEQILRLAQEVAGMSVQEADTLRKMMSENFPYQERQEKLKELNLKLAERHYPPSIQSRLAQQLLHMKSYGFVEGHAHSLGLLTYEQAYLVTHYPHYFAAAVLKGLAERNSERAYPVQSYINELHRLGVGFVFPPYLKLRSLPHIEENKIVVGRKIFGGNSQKNFSRKYNHLRILLGEGGNAKTIIRFQQQAFSLVLTHNPVEMFPDEYRFRPDAVKQQIIGRIVKRHPYNDLVFITLDSNELVHAIVPRTLLQQSKKLITTQQGWENFVRVDIGQSSLAHDKWQIIKFYPLVL